MHFAGFIQVEESVQDPKKYFENNTNNAIKLFNICKENGLNKIIFSSTAAAYGSVTENKLINEETILNPQNPYAESKIKTEKFLIKKLPIKGISVNRRFFPPRIHLNILERNPIAFANRVSSNKLENGTIDIEGYWIPLEYINQSKTKK